MQNNKKLERRKARREEASRDKKKVAGRKGGLTHSFVNMESIIWTNNSPVGGKVRQDDGKAERGRQQKKEGNKDVLDACFIALLFVSARPFFPPCFCLS